MAWDTAEVTRWERHLKAMVRDASTNDPEAFAELVRMADWLSREGLPQAAAGLQENGYSWAEIARPLGVSKPAAWQRFRRPQETGDLTPDA